LLSGCGCLRATDEEASGGGSVKGSPQFKNTKATTQKSVFRLPQFSHIPTYGGHCARFDGVGATSIKTEFPLPGKGLLSDQV